MNRRLSSYALCASLSLGVLAAGCGGSVATEAPAVAGDGAATKAPVAATTHGRVKLAAAALSDVPLRADQRVQIEKLATAADVQHSAVRTARQGLLSAL